MVTKAHAYLKNLQLKVAALLRYVSRPGNKRLKNDKITIMAQLFLQ